MPIIRYPSRAAYGRSRLCPDPTTLPRLVGEQPAIRWTTRRDVAGVPWYFYADRSGFIIGCGQGPDEVSFSPEHADHVADSAEFHLTALGWRISQPLWRLQEQTAPRHYIVTTERGVIGRGTAVRIYDDDGNLTHEGTQWDDGYAEQAFAALDFCAVDAGSTRADLRGDDGRWTTL